MGGAACKTQCCGGEPNCESDMAGSAAHTLEDADVSGELGERKSHRRQVTPPWTAQKGDDLQSSVDRIFATSDGKSLLGLEFSFTIADPFLEGCPLIGCSTGFTKLCGYELEDIVGRNCRFLIDPVPPEQIDEKMRTQTRAFCNAAKTNTEYRVPADEREDWMPENRPADELWCMQSNARKDGSIFNNMFYLKTVRLGADLGEEEPYIVGLQSELVDGKSTLAKLVKNHKQLDENMNQVVRELAGSLFVQCSMRRQDMSG